ncbi:MbtH family protein [Streptomyces sp. NPDC050504]|uniref:MbtH family protein n=1 Tax=Streptomyces sp. NPDC050504 TaxID=3365618 RepID=UPI00378982FB
MSRTEAQTEAGTEAQYKVVVNDEEQYSVWPAERANPAGWRDEGTRGPKSRCLLHIDAVWTDMRPRGVRERAAAAAA